MPGATRRGVLGGALAAVVGGNAMPAHAVRPVRTRKYGNVTVFEDSFTNGKFAPSWTLCQWNAGGTIRNDDCTGYSGTGEYSAQVVSDGSLHPNAARFELRNGDIPFSTTERCEIAEPLGAATEVAEGDERWFIWDMKFEAGFPVPTGNWCIPWQWHGSGGTSSPPLCLDIDTDDVIYLCNNDSTGLQRTAITSMTNVGRGVWRRWMVHAKFSQSSGTGFAEVEIDGSTVLAKHARKTMVTGEASCYFKMGLYRDPVNTSTQIVWHDNLLWRS